MASVNKVIIVGNLGRDPEPRSFPNGDSITTINVATTDRWRDKETGEPKESTTWHKVVFARRLAEIAEQYLRKGSQVYIEGALHTRKWTDRSTGQERYATEIRADVLQMLGQRGGQDGHRHYDAPSGDECYGGNTPPEHTPSRAPAPARRPAPAPTQSSNTYDRRKG